MSIKKQLVAFCFLAAACSSTSVAEPVTDIRLGVLAYGTVNWTLDTIEHEGLADTRGIRLVRRPVANAQAARIALQAGAVDIIVSDWLWVSRRRAAGADLTFFPYSATAGALVVPPDSSIAGVGDLSGRRLGIAGGELDKNWLLLRALAAKNGQGDLDATVEKVYGAPPLLNQQMLQGNLDALINYWHYAARLEARGYRILMDGRAMLRALGVEEQVPTLGYVFGEAWAMGHRAALERFLGASHEAARRLCESDAAWQAIAERTGTNDEAVRALLRKGYCQGRIRAWGDRQKHAAARVYDILFGVGGAALTGAAKRLQPGTFWSGEAVDAAQPPR